MEMQNHMICDKITRAFVCPEDAHKTGEGKSTKGRSDVERLEDRSRGASGWGVQGEQGLEVGGCPPSPGLPLWLCVSGWGDFSLSGA